MRRFAQNFAVSLVVLAPLACGGGSDDPPVDSAPPDESPDPTPGSSVGPDGGTVTNEALGARIEVPPGALSTATELSVSASGSIAPGMVGGESVTAISPVLQFGPAGTVFASPVTVGIELDEAPPAGATLYWTLRNDTSTFEARPSMVDGRTVTGTVDHFSFGFIGVPAATPSAPSVELTQTMTA
ncbi:MAG: hypothetical protein AAF658_21225, partial [Myxococcota bacterium]